MTCLSPSAGGFCSIGFANRCRQSKILSSIWTTRLRGRSRVKRAVLPSTSGLMPYESGRMRTFSPPPGLYVTSTSTVPEKSKAAQEEFWARLLPVTGSIRASLARWTPSFCQVPPSGRTLTVKELLTGTCGRGGWTTTLSPVVPVSSAAAACAVPAMLPAKPAAAMTPAAWRVVLRDRGVFMRNSLQKVR